MLDIKGFGARLKLAIKDSEYTQKQLSEKLRINQDTMTNYVKGTIPRADILYNICEHINVSVNYLLTGENENSNSDKVTYVPASQLKGSLRQAITEGETHKNITLELTERERNLVLAFRQFDDFDKEMVEDVVRNIFKRIEKINSQMSYTYRPGDEDAAAVAEESAEYNVKKHA